VTIAISSDFLLAFSNVHRSQQKQVREFIEKFREEPKAPGISYERIESAKGRGLYSVRINQCYRAVIFHPPGSDVYVLTWVDKHEEAYRWAERKRLEVNPVTGALQIFTAVATEAIAPAPAPMPPPTKGLFDAIRDRHLLRLGVPEELLPTVRRITTDSELEAAQELFPEEAYEALFMLASGYTVEEVFQEMGKRDEAVPVDPNDLNTALKNEDSQRRFYVIEEAKDLAELLNAPLEQWRVFLHPSQRRLVTMRAHGPVRVLGGAGTGKTVVAMHRARFLAEEVFNRKEDRILFTTFTRNLAVDIQDNLRKICSAEALSRIDVINLDAWVANYLHSQGYCYQVVLDEEENEAWSAALELAPADLQLPPSFYRSEWEDVVQAQNIADLDQYLRASRIGRGTRLSRDMKKRIWPVFQRYRAQLNERGKKEYIDLIRDARGLIESKRLSLPYRAIVVDEAQDMSAEALRLVRAMVPEGPNDIFVVGDAHQRIYRHRASLRRCGINIMGRGRKLRVNYRTTEEIRRFAVKLLEDRPIDDLDEGIDPQKGYMSLTHGRPPLVRAFASLADEVTFVKEHIDELVNEGTPLNSICLVARTKRILDLYASRLHEVGISTYEIRRDAPEQRDRPGLRVATMHRVKGLEFDYVIVVSANQGVIPLEAAVTGAEDAVGRRNAETRERCLLHVAVTRARRGATITGYGALSPFLT
jgi:superfamily I DNA/RNA helicase